MDLLTKSVFEAAAATDMPTARVNRHLAILRTALPPDDETRLSLLELSFGYHEVRYLLWFWAHQPQQMVELESAVDRAFGEE